MPKTAAKTAKKSELPASLRQKIAASQVGSKPSLIPPGIGGQPPLPPRPMKVEKAPDIADLMDDGEDRETLTALVSQYHTINTTKKQAAAAIKPLGERIKTILGNYGINHFTYVGVDVNYYLTERKTLNRGKLLAAGVSIEILEACTDVSASGALRIGGDE